MTVQHTREQFQDLAMSIFTKDPPNDPKTLYETRDQGSLKIAALGITAKPKATKHEVCVPSACSLCTDKGN